MNAKLKKVPDGTQTSVWIVSSDGKPRESVHSVYWPFSMVDDDYDVLKDRVVWSITHLPSGYKAAWQLSKRKALRLIGLLRGSGLDFSFTKPSGKKWAATKGPMKAIMKGEKSRPMA